VHIYRLHTPLVLMMKCLLSKYSKKRQNDLISFTSLILSVIYTSHISACLWLWLGAMSSCEDLSEEDAAKCI